MNKNAYFFTKQSNMDDVHSPSTRFARDLHLSPTNTLFCLASPGEASAAALFWPKGWRLKPVLAGKCCASSVMIRLRLVWLLLLIPSLYLSACHSPSYPSLKGDDVSIPNNEGWVLINYWAEWCHPCLQEIPEINQLAINLPKPLVAVYGIYFDKVTNEALLDKVKRFHVNYPMLSTEINKYPVPVPNVLPSNYLMDSEGKIYGPLIGPQTQESVMQAIKKYSFSAK